MGKKSGKRTQRTTKASRRARKPKQRRWTTGGVSPVVWMGAVVIVVALAVLVVWQSGVLAGPFTPSQSQEPSDLLPLAEAVRPLHGIHDMALIPEQTPLPQPAPSDVPLPRLDMPSVSYDFGRVPARSDVAHPFAVQNTGSAALVIRKLVTSCGCTTADLSSSVILPGQRADLTVNFDLDFHEIQGEVTRLVWFATNDPSQPWVEVRITAVVES